jgi:hypothetical protein
MPGKQPFICERLGILAPGVEHHFNDTFDIAVGGLEGADIHTKAARDGGPDLFCVKFLPLDLAALERVGGQGLEDSFLTEVEAKGFDVPVKRPWWCRTSARRYLDPNGTGANPAARGYTFSAFPAEIVACIRCKTVFAAISAENRAPKSPQEFGRPGRIDSSGAGGVSQNAGHDGKGPHSSRVRRNRHRLQALRVYVDPMENAFGIGE